MDNRDITNCNRKRALAEVATPNALELFASDPKPCATSSSDAEVRRLL
ncbi:MAG: hypothetical protein ABSG36_18410 [Acidimicrobiales bacterium]|jgi:hypothetical protein